MSTNSAIEWTDCTWNPVVGCTRVSAGCDHCYAVRQSFRLEQFRKVAYTGLTVLNSRGERHFNGTVRIVPEALELPLHWKKPRRVFVNSMSDLFHKDVPFDFIDRVFAVMALCPQHTFQVLTKRPERMAEYMPGKWDDGRGVYCEYKRRKPDNTMMPWPLPNVILGTSCEDQASADERIPHLLRCPAAVRMLSLEPLLGPIDMEVVSRPPCFHCQPHGWSNWWPTQIQWVIVGGESGPKARPCNVDWIRSIIAQCKAAGVTCFVKQLGHYAILDKRYERAPFPATRKLADPKGGDMDEWPEDLRVREFPK